VKQKLRFEKCCQNDTTEQVCGTNLIANFIRLTRKKNLPALSNAATFAKKNKNLKIARKHEDKSEMTQE
jgi:hypothetical protein